MATSKPTYQNIVYSNGTAYCALYKREISDISSVETTQWYWMPSTQGGNLINYRDNNLNGFFTSQSNALANIPSGYNTPSSDFTTRKIIGYYQQFPFNDGATSIARTKTEYLDAYNRGARDFVVKIEWTESFPTYSSQTANSTTGFARNKDLCDYIIALGTDTTISLRICTDRDDGSVSGFYDLSTDQSQNELNYPSRVAYGSGHVSLAYTAGVNIVKDFVDKTLTYFNGLYTGRILWFSIGMTAQNEAGYNYENQSYAPVQGQGTVSNSAGGTTVTGTGTNFTNILNVGDSIKIGSQTVSVTAITSNTSITVSAITNANTNAVFYYFPLSSLYPSFYDYTTHVTSGFRTWLQAPEQYNNSISALNTSYGESHANFTTVVPPKAGSVSVGDKTTEQICSIFATNKGKDWWKYNYSLLKTFLTDCKAIGASKAPTAKFCVEWGSTTDILSPLRLSLLINEMDSYSDMMKAQLGILDTQPNLAHTVDMIAPNYAGKIGTELNDHDATNGYGAVSAAQIESMMTQIGVGSVQNGATYILIMSDKTNPVYFGAMMNVLTNVRNAMIANNQARITPTTLPSSVANVTIGQRLESPLFALQAWQSRGGSNTNRVYLRQTSDYGLGSNTGGCQFPLSIHGTLQTFCLNNTNMKSYAYTDSNGNNVPANEAFYNQNMVRFMVPTHSITYVSGSLAKSNWQLVGASDGIVYISNVQKLGYYSNNDGSAPEQNNHPDRRYIKTSAEDAVYYLPKSQNYYIKMTNTGPVNLTFQVDQMDVNANHDTINIHKQKLTVGMAEQSFLIVTETIPNTAIRQIKINCNRDSVTDTL